MRISDLSSDVGSSDLLLVDDVADSGRTLALAVKLLRDRSADMRSVVISPKPTTIVRPDYSWKDTPLWIDIPGTARGTAFDEDADARKRDGAGNGGVVRVYIVGRRTYEKKKAKH